MSADNQGLTCEVRLYTLFRHQVLPPFPFYSMFQCCTLCSLHFSQATLNGGEGVRKELSICDEK